MLNYKENETLKRLLKLFGFFLLLSAPVVLFLFTFAISNRNGVLYGDWDYFAQAYEAARQSILEYGQFPWWNPWVIGGVPLFANPQFGLISIQMPLVLLFGTVQGLHLAILAYYLLGFWGMYRLLKRLGGTRLLSTLLSYVWVFATFPAWHVAGGHLTFAQYLLAPWFFLALLNLRRFAYGWLWLGLIITFLIYQSMHYLTVQILFVGGLFVLYELFIRWREHKLTFWKIIKPYVLAGIVVLVLASPRILLTMDYMSAHTRIPAPEEASSKGLIIDSLVQRQRPEFSSLQYGWVEYTAYFGILTLMLLSYLIFRLIETKKMTRRQWLLVGAMLFFLVLSLGPFKPWSPYALLKELPVFEQMQAAARWLAWFLFAGIIFLSKLPRKPFVYIILVLSIIDVFAASRIQFNKANVTYTPPETRNEVIDQQAYYTNQPEIDKPSNRFLHATQSNTGDVFGYEPIGQFSLVAQGDFFRGLTLRCGSNESDCPFVLTKNAVVTSWSPQHIELKRTGPGEIELNMNPGKMWLINGQRFFGDQRYFELKKRFVIGDPAEHIVVHYRPL